jgi:NAD(P)-dependent dehydrogenase (short-subunit alcohol dehydrogenase family)
MNKITGQKPLISGFGPRTTAEEVLGARDLRGMVAIVTGGHAGLGLETTRVLSNGGATVVVGSRDPIQQIPSWRQGQSAGYRAAQRLREGRRTGRPTDVRSKGTPK